MGHRNCDNCTRTRSAGRTSRAPTCSLSRYEEQPRPSTASPSKQHQAAQSRSSLAFCHPVFFSPRCGSPSTPIVDCALRLSPSLLARLLLLSAPLVGQPMTRTGGRPSASAASTEMAISPEEMARDARSVKIIRAARLLVDSEAEIIDDGAVAEVSGKILYAGPRSGLEQNLRTQGFAEVTEPTQDLGDVTLMPGRFRLDFVEVDSGLPLRLRSRSERGLSLLTDTQSRLLTTSIVLQVSSTAMFTWSWTQGARGRRLTFSS